MKLNELLTPAILINESQVKKNIRKAQKIANTHQVDLRPHVKTHKSTLLFQWQQEAGASGITASKLDEALPFIANGVRSVTFAYPVVDSVKLGAFVDKVKSYEALEIILAVDSQQGLEAAYEVATKHQFHFQIQLLINVGYNRCGLEPKSPKILEFAKQMKKYKYVHLKGILAHNGLTYGAKNYKGIRAYNKTEMKQLLKVQKRLAKKGYEIESISVGSTPGVFVDDVQLSGVTEIRPGNYIFMDRTPVELGLIKKREVAMTILAQVISENPEYYIIDAGKKVLSGDQRSGMNDYGLVYPMNKFAKKKSLKIIKMSEEHGFVGKSDELQLQVGDKVRILPNHSCVVANLGFQYCLHEGDKVTNIIPIDAIKISQARNQL